MCCSTWQCLWHVHSPCRFNLAPEAEGFIHIQFALSCQGSENVLLQPDGLRSVPAIGWLLSAIDRWSVYSIDLQTAPHQNETLDSKLKWIPGRCWDSYWKTYDTKRTFQKNQPEIAFSKNSPWFQISATFKCIKCAITKYKVYYKVASDPPFPTMKTRSTILCCEPNTFI